MRSWMVGRAAHARSTRAYHASRAPRKRTSSCASTVGTHGEHVAFWASGLMAQHPVETARFHERYWAVTLSRLYTTQVASATSGPRSSAWSGNTLYPKRHGSRVQRSARTRDTNATWESTGACHPIDVFKTVS